MVKGNLNQNYQIDLSAQINVQLRNFEDNTSRHRVATPKRASAPLGLLDDGTPAGSAMFDLPSTSHKDHWGRDMVHNLDDVVPCFQKFSSYPDVSHYCKLSSRNGAPNDVDHSYFSTLVIDTRKTRHWQVGISGQEKEIKVFTDAAFTGSLSAYGLVLLVLIGGMVSAMNRIGDVNWWCHL